MEDFIGTDDYVRLLNDTARVALSMGQTAKAVTLLDKAIATIEEMGEEE